MAAQKFEDELSTPWTIKKQQILKDYQVTSIRVSANFMKDEDNREEVKALKSVDRTKARLDQLEDNPGEVRSGEEHTDSSIVSNADNTTYHTTCFARRRPRPWT